MKQHRHEEGRFTEHAHGLGTVTEEMIRHRAGEIALISGRSTRKIIEADIEQARRELLGEEGLNPESSAEEQLPEGSRAIGIENTGDGRVEAVPAPDEQTFAEKLVEEGVQEAEHEQMVQATRESLRKDVTE